MARSVKTISQSAFADIDESMIGTLYYITWNPRNSVYAHVPNGYDPQSQTYDVSWHNMISYLKLIRRCSDCFCILPEISDAGKLHCHGWFNMKDKIKWVKSVYPTLYRHGMIRIKKVKEIRDDFDDYMHEDLNETLNYIRDPTPMCLTHESLSDIIEYLRRKKIILYDETVDFHYKHNVKSVDITSFFK